MTRPSNPLEYLHPQWGRNRQPYPIERIRKLTPSPITLWVQLTAAEQIEHLAMRQAQLGEFGWDEPGAHTQHANRYRMIVVRLDLQDVPMNQPLYEFIDARARQILADIEVTAASKAVLALGHDLTDEVAKRFTIVEPPVKPSPAADMFKTVGSGVYDSTDDTWTSLNGR